MINNRTPRVYTTVARYPVPRYTSKEEESLKVTYSVMLLGSNGVNEKSAFGFLFTTTCVGKVKESLHPLSVVALTLIVNELGLT